MTKQLSQPIIDMPSKEQLEMAIRPYSDEDVEESSKLQDKIEKLMHFFDEAGIDYSKFNPEEIPKLDLSQRKAYPNFDQYMYIPGQHNTQKWLSAVREIYSMEKENAGRVQAIRQATSGWNIMETYDFLNWLKFHEAGDHLKYKFAQLWYENGAPGYFLHVKPDPPKAQEPAVTGRDIDFARDSIADELTKNERKQIIEKQRNKIIGRLDSAEKLLRSPDGQIFAGKEFEVLMEAIYQLKKKIQLVNKVSTSTRLYEDIIVREANILHKNGFIKAANMLHSLAQTPGQSAGQLDGKPIDNKGGKIPQAASPDDPTGAGHPGAPGGLPSMGPGMPQNAPSASVPETGPNEMAPIDMKSPVGPPPTTAVVPPSPMPKKEKPKGISEFLENMNTSKLTTTEDQAGSEDGLEVDDVISVAESDDYLLVTDAQAVDVPMTTTPAPDRPAFRPAFIPADVPEPPKGETPEAPMAPATEEPLEVTEDDIPVPQGINVSDFDSKIDAVFSNITVDDVVAKLEDIAKIFKNREIPRQLGIVDMMLDSLGLATYFPSLSEATNKALDSNNYISTRVEDIISKLRGAMNTKDIDLKSETGDKPEVAGIKNKLQQDADKEKSRKQQRKDQEVAELTGPAKETPKLEIAEDLGVPPVPAAPAIPPAVPPPV